VSTLAAIHDFQHAAAAVFGRVARLAHSGVSIELQRGLLLSFVFVTIAGAVYQSADNPRGMLRRFSTGYVVRLDTQQRAMFLPETGSKTAWTQLLTVIGILILYGFYPLNALPVIALLVLVVPPVLIARQVAQRRAKIDEQANGFALSLANALKATASIGDALKGATDVTANPLKDELGTVLRQVRVGSTLEEALLALSARVQSTALDVVVSALLIGRQTGGDLPRILEGVAGSLRELKRLENLTDKVSRSAKQSLGISAAVTAGLAVGLPYMFPGFLDPLRTTLKGQIYSGQMLLVYFAALYLGYRFTRKSI
jgi:tight adherence protein B